MTHQHVVHLIVVLGLTCTPLPPPDPPSPVPHEGAGCAEACARMRTLDCELGTPTRHGAECEEVCLNVQDGPPQIQGDLACLAGAQTCSGCDGRDPLQ